MESEKVWVKNVESIKLNKVSWLAGRWNRIVDLSSESKRGLIFTVGRLEPNEVADWHQHPEDEVFFVFKGQGVVCWRIGEQELSASIEPGSAFFKGGGIFHKMISNSSEPLIGVGCKV